MSKWYDPYYQQPSGQYYRQYYFNVPQPQPLRQPYGTYFSQFRPIRPSTKDELILPKGYKYDIVATWGEDLGNGEKFGYNNDFTCYFGNNPNEGLLWVNHEYIGHMSIFVTGYKEEPGTKRTAKQIAIEKYNLGGSVIHIRKGAAGNWSIVKGSKYNRRITGNTPINLTGPAKGDAAVGGVTKVIGTFANCSGGKTLWNTVFSGEENYEGIVEDWSESPEVPPLNPTHYGWVVEVDPNDPTSIPKKHTMLGRFAHENAVMTLGKTGRLVVYTGDDANDQCVYKFVSDGVYKPELGKQNGHLLENGTLYVADMGSNKWIPLDLNKTPKLKDNYKTQGELLVNTREAAKLAGGTPLDRPEDIEIHPRDGSVFIAFTNNLKHGNYYGQIYRLVEGDNNHESTSFVYEIFVSGGPQSGFACPDNLMFDQSGNLWVCTDISSDKTNQGAYSPFKNNGLFMIPTEGPNRGKAIQFASAPVQAELTGTWLAPGGETLFMSVQHPGEESKDVNNPTSRWPYGDIPRPSVVAISKQ
ncbi:PhoX family phosphatase [Bacillus sp. V2I10]|uniref:PhoX family protein n=1 Tax=Bacillus sp. V2I10 TaxID=3042276 RepID=UPI0027897394|nr:alkaline phosphatase PhoX [Bacillus sp. V2I10]MDQ0859857.1 secreted PhoX family phosphatase [Bacillus sp. V2I10]